MQIIVDHDKLDSGHLNSLRLNQLPCSIMNKRITRPNPFHTLHHKLLQESSFNILKYGYKTITIYSH